MKTSVGMKTVIAATALFAIACINHVVAAEKDAKTSAAIDGTWTLVSVDNVNPDGTRAPRHGAKPAGQLIFDGMGHYSLIVLTPGTPEEYKAALEGDNCDYGRYTVNDADHSVTFYMDHANHRNLEGSSHTRFYTVKDDELRYTTTRLDANGKAAKTYGEVVLKRAPKQ